MTGTSCPPFCTLGFRVRKKLIQSCSVMLLWYGLSADKQYKWTEIIVEGSATKMRKKGRKNL